MSKHLKSISVSDPDAANLPSLETWYRFSSPSGPTSERFLRLRPEVAYALAMDMKTEAHEVRDSLQPALDCISPDGKEVRVMR